MKRTAKFKYAGHDVTIRWPDGYVNVTELCHAERSNAYTVMRGREWRSYVAVIEKKLQICRTSLIESRRGRGAHTFTHPVIASWIAERLSPEAAWFIHTRLHDLHLTGIVVELAERSLPAETQEVARTAAIAAVQEMRALGRAPVAEWVRQAHLACALTEYKGACPSCTEPVARFEIDHFYGPSDAQLCSTWPICRHCNQARRKLPAAQRLAERDHFDRYQAKLRVFSPEKFAEQQGLF